MRQPKWLGMEREPGKLNQVELGLRVLGEVGNQVGLDDYYRAFAFRHGVKGGLEFMALLRWRLNPDHGKPSLRQSLNAFRQVFPHLGSVLR